MQDDTSSKYRVVPFGNPRIKGHLHLPAAYRSLSRPSSPPRAKASAMCPYLLFVLPITYGRYILSAFNFTFFWSHHVKERCFNYKTIIKTEWRITDSNRWPPACKAGALASWANPPICPFFVLRLQRNCFAFKPPNKKETFFRVVPGRVELPTSTLSV